MLWITISIIGTCDDKTSRVKVNETLEKSPKTRTFVLYFTSFNNLQGKAKHAIILVPIFSFSIFGKK